jgi:hypothetical protein
VAGGALAEPEPERRAGRRLRPSQSMSRSPRAIATLTVKESLANTVNVNVETSNVNSNSISNVSSNSLSKAGDSAIMTASLAAASRLAKSTPTLAGKFGVA